MKSAQIRQNFLDFFAARQHQIVDSSSLVPANDPTLLFTNSGMVQFKDYFLGQIQPPYHRAVSSQRCVRAGGKHNDLENVGYTARHHTFFEMLGNFSFGDYFKRDAIQYCWQFLTEELKLPKEKLWVTVHHSDSEAEQIWINDIGIDPNRISHLDKDNFWQMGDTGPCGPCSEVFYDHGEGVEGDPPGGPNDDGDRYIEIWNLVFMQYELQPDGSKLPLPKPCVDTGMGLERIAAVLQGVHNNYDIDLFQNLLSAAAKALNVEDLSNQSLRVIADHIRSSCFLIIDDVLPSNEGRGYVLRRIIRRALRHGNKLGASGAFFHQLVQSLVDEMGAAYPQLVSKQTAIETILLREEQQFSRTLDKGLGILEQCIDVLQGTTIPGEIIFKLYDTYGFPVDLTNDIAREKGLSLDVEGYEVCMQGQRQQARESNQFDATQQKSLELQGSTQFVGYNQLSCDTTITYLFDEQGNAVQRINEDEDAILVLDQTPFYAESGGQVGDNGIIRLCSSSSSDPDSGAYEAARFEVRDCLSQQHHHLHYGRLLSGSLSVNDSVTATVNNSIRSATAANHSATHLLHASLRNTLGSHVTQKGSLVDSQKLRFDFSHDQPLSTQQLRVIIEAVNQQVRDNNVVSIETMSMDQAKNKGAMALFGEKYGDQVRVLSMGSETDNEPYSVELCGGTHVRNTGDIGLFSIVSEAGIASGVRRIEAITGQEAIQHHLETREQLLQLQALFKAGNSDLLAKAEQLLGNQRQLQKDNEKLQMQLASGKSQDISDSAIEIHGVKVLLKQLPKIETKALRQLIDQLKDKLGNAIILLASVDGDKVSLIAGASKAVAKRVSASALLQQVATTIGGKGGGRDDMAQGGGNQPQLLDKALKDAQQWVELQLQESDGH